MGRSFEVLGVALLVVIAGCSGVPGNPAPTTVHPSPTTTSPAPTTVHPSPSSSPTEPPTDGTPSPSTDETSIEVQGGSLPVDPVVAWQRTQRLLATNVTPPDRVVVSRPVTRTYAHPRFYQLLTGCPDETFTSNEGGRVRSPDTVSLYVDSGTPESTIEKILVHEYTHVVQFRTRATRNLSGNVFGAILQGAAIYTADAYAQTYRPDTSLQSTGAVARYRAASPCKRVIFSQNYFGYRYVAHRVDSPRDLHDVYADPPRTSEQLIHEMSPGAEPPRPLSVHVERPAASEWLLVGNGTKGELAVRSVLWTHLSPARARRAATGWGNDRLLQFWNGTVYGYVWVLRWDDATNATEFTSTLGEYFDDRATATETGWADGTVRFAVEPTSADTVVVIAGDESFVRETNVTESNGTVSVAIGSRPR